jgi:hypothetical protein
MQRMEHQDFFPFLTQTDCPSNRSNLSPTPLDRFSIFHEFKRGHKENSKGVMLYLLPF